MTVGQRLRRAIELIVGAGVGVGVATLLISTIGIGPWQIGDRLVDGLIGAAMGLMIDAVFARSSVRDPAVSVTGTRALAKTTEGGARR